MIILPPVPSNRIHNEDDGGDCKAWVDFTHSGIATVKKHLKETLLRYLKGSNIGTSMDKVQNEH